jgi:hypothetical protein
MFYITLRKKDVYNHIYRTGWHQILNQIKKYTTGFVLNESTHSLNPMLESQPESLVIFG